MARCNVRRGQRGRRADALESAKRRRIGHAPAVANLCLPTLDDRWLQHVETVSRRVLQLNDLREAALGRAVAQVSHVYTRERHNLAELVGDDDALCARLRFFLSRDLLKVHGPIAELASVGAFPLRDELRVLDLGAGLGATSLGLSRATRILGLARSMALTALDVDDAALEILRELAANVQLLPGLPLRVQTHEHDLRNPVAKLPLPATARFDVILLGLTLNELVPAHAPDAGARVAERLEGLASWLADDGVLIAIEPALRETSRVLHAARDAIVARAGSRSSSAPALHVFAPCLGPARCPMLERERDFCHERIETALPPRLAAIARAAGLRESDLTYSYLTLHRQPRSLSELRSDRTLARAVSGQLRTKGKRELWLCGPTGAPRAMRLDCHESDANAAFEQAERGAVLSLDSASTVLAQPRLRIEKEAHVALEQVWQPCPEHHPANDEVADP